VSRKENGLFEGGHFPNEKRIKFEAILAGATEEYRTGQRFETVELSTMDTALLLAGVRSAASADDQANFNTDPFTLTVTAAAISLAPAKFWTRTAGDGWSRRLTLMGLGAFTGLGAMWLNGWSPSLLDPNNGPVRSASVFGPASGGGEQ
jgi:hypothetical protein